MFKPASLLLSDTQLNQRSYYEASVQRSPAQTALQQSVVSDVVVVGGGFTGLHTAIELAERGYSVVLLEADRVGSSASGRNGGQIIAGLACGQGELESQLGATDARRVWDMTVEGLRIIEERCQRYGIDADLRKGYLYVADRPRKAKALLQDAEDLQNLGLNCEVATDAQVRSYIDTDRYQACVYESVSGHVHPLKLALGLLQAARQLGVKVYEHTPALSRQHVGAQVVLATPQGQVQAQHVVLAGNCLLPEISPQLAVPLQSRIMPVGTYMLATAPVSAELAQRLIARHAAVCDNNFVLDYFRFSADHRMLFGGRVSYTTLTPPHLQQRLQARMARIFPELASVPVEHVWGGFVDITMNRAPDFGRLHPQVTYLQGFSGHGVVLAAVAGRVAAESVAGQHERFDVLARLRHHAFPGGSTLRTPMLALGMLWYRLRDLLG